MHVGRAGRQCPLVLTGNGLVVVGLGAGSDVDVAVATGFLDGLLRPDAGFDVVRRAAFGEQVQGNLGKLLAGAALQEQHFIVGRDAKQIAQVLFGLFGDGGVVLAAMAHFHHRETLATPVQHFSLGALQYGFGKRGGACAEVKGSIAHIHSRSA